MWGATTLGVYAYACGVWETIGRWGAVCQRTEYGTQQGNMRGEWKTLVYKDDCL